MELVTWPAPADAPQCGSSPERSKNAHWTAMEPQKLLQLSPTFDHSFRTSAMFDMLQMKMAPRADSSKLFFFAHKISLCLSSKAQFIT